MTDGCDHWPVFKCRMTTSRDGLRALPRPLCKRVPAVCSHVAPRHIMSNSPLGLTERIRFGDRSPNEFVVEVVNIVDHGQVLAGRVLLLDLRQPIPEIIGEINLVDCIRSRRRAVSPLARP